MSTVVVKINEDKLSDLKKFIRTMKAKMLVIKDEEDIMAKLIDEGLSSEEVSETEMKKEFKKHGIDL